MNVQVKHNGTTITGFVTEYERVHKICTGIGSLSISIVDTIPRTFVPWDSIDIYENGDFKVRYYVSSVEHNVPRSTLTLDCQDNSKRIVDYFIPDSYTVDYPSYTKYWISKFLDEAGVSYEYSVDSPGTLLSNFTNLGLVTVYEQVLTLLQMSGWYMYFDGNGKAIIGTLQTELADDLESVGKTDILNILVTKDDKMLRNKALVFGAYDAFTDSNAKASVTVHTPWNYDHRDIRTVVISNSNIPNDSTAYGMANQIVKEFSKITVEKHITLWGARDFNLGTALRVTSNVYKGKGLVTTFGTSMSKTGLVTNVVLDERCPRLFGYFDFGDYVYVSFYGDGVWRKHIKFDPAWYNFSTGLTNLNITDLHVNQGIFSAVGNSGEMYRAIDNTPWYPIGITSLMSSVETVVSGSQIELGSFSGIQARATIIDRVGNVIKYGVDTYSGNNTGDYFMSASGIIGTVTTSGNVRGWIVDYDPFTGEPLGGIGSGVYPINYSGNYNVRVLDLENDGKNDFVSIALGGAGDLITGDPVTQQYNYGSGHGHEILPTSKRSWSTLSGSPSATTAVFTQNTWCYGAVDNIDEHEIYYCTSTAFLIRKYKNDNTTGSISLLSSTTVSLTAGYTPVGNNNVDRMGAAIIKTGINEYKFLAEGNNISAPRYSVITINHLGSESYSVTYTSVVTDGAVSFTGQNGRYCSIAKSDDSSFDRLRYAGLIDLVSASYSLSLVHSSGGTSTDRKEPTTRFSVVNGTLVGTGFQIEWNSSTPTSITLYPLYLDGFSIVKGSSLATGNFTLVMTSQRVTRTLHTSYATVLGTTYAVYNDGIVVSGADMTLGFHPILDPAFDDVAIRVTTGQVLQYSTGHITTWTNVTLPGSEVPVTGPLTITDSVTGTLYIRTRISSTDYLIGIDWGTKAIVSRFARSTVLLASNPSAMYPTSVGNILIIINGSTLSAELSAYIIRNLTPDVGTGGNGYMVLRRDGLEYTLIEEESYPIRVDISNSSPLVTVGSGESTFVSNYVYETELVTIEAASGIVSGGRQVNDYRYTFIQPTSGGVSSGSAISSTILYVYGSGVFGADALNYSGGFTQMFTVPSGHGTRIETSNYGVGGQYVFVTASGFVQTFFQQDPASLGFTNYGTGFPQSRATMIRLDDMM